MRSAYYATFYAASAALRSAELEARTHRGLRTRFAEHFVRTGRIAQEDGIILAQTFATRQDADYDDGAILTDELVESTISDVVRFVGLIEQILDEERKI